MANPIDRLEKALIMLVSAVQAGAVVSNLPDNLAVSPDISDPNLRAENLMAWELQRIFYSANVGALADDTNWPPPDIGLGSLAGGLPAMLGNVVNFLPEPWKSIVQGLLNGTGGGTPPVIPPPGPAPAVLTAKP